MLLLSYKIAAAILIFLISIVAAIYPLSKKGTHVHFESLHLGEALASGIFLGAAFFHMLPDAIKLFNQLYGPERYPFPELICVLGFLSLLFLERASLSTSAKNTIPYIITLTLVIHALTEGAALGIGSTLSETIMLLIAIAAHKGSECFALCVTLLRHQLPYKRIVLIVVLFALMTPIGIALGAAVNIFAYAPNGEFIEALFNAFAAGTFLYISTLHHVHFHQHRQDAQGLLEFSCLVLGVSMMGVIALWA